MPGADMAGYSGFVDQVNNHYFRIFGNASAAVRVSPRQLLILRIATRTITTSNQAPNMSSEMSAALGQVFGQAIAQVVQKT